MTDLAAYSFNDQVSDIKLANVARYRSAVESARNDWSAS